MGRNSSKKSNKKKQKFYTKGNFYVGNITLAQAFEPFDNADLDKAAVIIGEMVSGCMACIMMAQISISAKPEEAEWVEKLDSVKDIKSKILNGKTGLLFGAAAGLTLAFPYALEELSQDESQIGNNLYSYACEMMESHTTNVKRIRPNKENWGLYARGEMGAIKGQLISCPTTSLRTLNIDGSQVNSYGVTEAIRSLGFDLSTLDKYGITTQSVIEKVRGILLIDNNGMPIKSLIYEEPDFITSKVQNEIVGYCLVRNASLKNVLEKGVEPALAITKANLKKFLTDHEFFAYNIAIRTGDAQMAKRLSDKAIGRSKDIPK